MPGASFFPLEWDNILFCCSSNPASMKENVSHFDELPSRIEQTKSKYVGERNWTFNIFSRARTSIYSPFFIKTDLKDLLRAVQYNFFIVSQSETSNILTARKGWFFKVFLRVTSVRQLSFNFFHTDICSAKFRDIQTELETITSKSCIKTHDFCPSAFLDCTLSFKFFNYQSAHWGLGQIASTSASLFHSPACWGHRWNALQLPSMLCSPDFLFLVESEVLSQGQISVVYLS